MTNQFDQLIHFICYCWLVRSFSPYVRVVEGVLIPFRTQILEKFMCHIYFKQHFTHQGKLQMSPLVCKDSEKC